MARAVQATALSDKARFVADRQLTDDEAREIARRIAAAVSAPPDADNRSVLDVASGSQSLDDANEDRVERALVEEGFAPPEDASKRYPYRYRDR